MECSDFTKPVLVEKETYLEWKMEVIIMARYIYMLLQDSSIPVINIIRLVINKTRELFRSIFLALYTTKNQYQ